jgi:hypothetical protein
MVSPQTEIQRQSPRTGVISIDREMCSPRTEIQRDIMSMDSCYLYGQRDGIPTDRYTERQSPRIEKFKYHRQRDFFSMAANARFQGR